MRICYRIYHDHLGEPVDPSSGCLLNDPPVPRDNCKPFSFPPSSHAFHDDQDDFYDYTLSESARLDQVRDAARGVYTAPGTTHIRSISQIRKLLKEYSTSFSERMQNIVQGLQSHPDLDCRFLGIRLSFSEFYRVKRG